MRGSLLPVDGRIRLNGALRLAIANPKWYSQNYGKWPYSTVPLIASLGACGNDSRFSACCSPCCGGLCLLAPRPRRTSRNCIFTSFASAGWQPVAGNDGRGDLSTGRFVSTSQSPMPRDWLCSQGRSADAGERWCACHLHGGRQFLRSAQWHSSDFRERKRKGTGNLPGLLYLRSFRPSLCQSASGSIERRGSTMNVPSAPWSGRLGFSVRSGHAGHRIPVWYR